MVAALTSVVLRSVNNVGAVSYSVGTTSHAPFARGRNDGQHGQLNHDKMEKVAALESSPRRNSGLLHASSNFLASLRGAGVTAQARNSSSHNLGTASNDKKIKDESWIVQMNRVMGNQSPLTAHRKKCHSPHRESTDETLKGQIINKLNVVLNTSSGIAKSQSSGQFKVQTGGGLATKTMNISNLGEFESIGEPQRVAFNVCAAKRV